MIRDAHDSIRFGLFPISSILFQMSSLYSYCITIRLCVHQSLEHTSLVVKDSELLDDGNKLGHEALVSRIFLEIVCPVLEGTELEAKAMSQAILFCPISCDLSPLLILGKERKRNLSPSHHGQPERTKRLPFSS